MTSDIIRLRGSAPPLIWPAAKLAPILTALAAERGQWDGFYRHIQAKTHPESMCGAPPHPAALKGVHVAYARIATIAPQAAQCFAAANGLTVRQGPRLVNKLRFVLEHPRELDHPEFFAAGGGRRISLIVVHPYLTALPLEVVPQGWVVDALPVSWYSYGNTTAYALRPEAHV